MRSYFTLVLICCYCIYVIPAFADEVIISEPGVMITYSPELHNKSQMVFRKYNFSLSQPTKVRLNFKSEIANKVSIKLIETETEIPIRAFDKAILKRYSPCNIEADLSAKAYTFLVLQHRPVGSINNTGVYSFSMSKIDEPSPVVDKKVQSQNNTLPNKPILEAEPTDSVDKTKQTSNSNVTKESQIDLDRPSEKQKSINISFGSSVKDWISLITECGALFGYFVSKKWIAFAGGTMLAALIKIYL